MSRYSNVLSNETNPLYINDIPINLNGHRAILTKSDVPKWIPTDIPLNYFGEQTAIVFKDKIHIFGGHASNNPNGYHITYDGENFENLSSNLPIFSNGSRYDPAGCNVLVYNDELYIFGGGMTSVNDTNSRKAFFKYDGTNWYEIFTAGNYVKTSDRTPKSGKTYYTRTETEPYEYIEFTGSTFVSGVTYYEHKNVKKISLPYGFYMGSVGLFEGEIHIFGGGTNSYRKKHYVFRNDAWSALTALPKPLRSLNGAELYVDEVNVNYLSLVYTYIEKNVTMLASYNGRYSNDKKTKWVWDNVNIGIHKNGFLGFVRNFINDHKKLQFYYSEFNDYNIAETYRSVTGPSSKDIYLDVPELDIVSNVLYYKDKIIIISNGKLYTTKELYDLTIEAI